MISSLTINYIKAELMLFLCHSSCFDLRRKKIYCVHKISNNYFDDLNNLLFCEAHVCWINLILLLCFVSAFCCVFLCMYGFILFYLIFFSSIHSTLCRISNGIGCDGSNLPPFVFPLVLSALKVNFKMYMENDFQN